MEMEILSIKMWLNSYQDIKKESEHLLDLIEELQAPLYDPKTPKLTGMPPAASPDPNAARDALIDKHEKLLERYIAQRLKLEILREEIENAIEQLDPRARKLMRLKYIEGLTWEEVSIKMAYSERQTHRIRLEALNQLQKNTQKPGA